MSRRTGIRTNRDLPETDITGYIPGVTRLVATHNETGNKIEGLYFGLSASKKSLKINHQWADQNKYTFTESE